jgi:hypothetical protein
LDGLGIWVAEVPLDDFAKQDIRPIRYDFPEPGLYSGVAAWAQTAGLVYIVQVFSMEQGNAHSKGFVLNLKSPELLDLCVSADYGPIGGFYFSGDGQLAAWRKEDGQNWGVVVMRLTDGHRILLPNFVNLNGWIRR